MTLELHDPRRQEPSFLLDERTMLEAWLEFHRVTLLLKCDGLTHRTRTQRPIPTSRLSLHGLVRHLTEVERTWFGRVLLWQDPPDPVWAPSASDDIIWEVEDADWDDDLRRWHDECDRSRWTAADLALDDAGLRNAEPCSLRWIYNHLIEEYARHNGHADLLRELADQSVGW